MEQNHDVDYFINKFEAIPEKKWTTGLCVKMDIKGEISHCALGHCGSRSTFTKTREGAILNNLMIKYLDRPIHNINDIPIASIPIHLRKDYHVSNTEDTPRVRVLEALYHIKKIIEKEKTESLINETLKKKECRDGRIKQEEFIQIPSGSTKQLLLEELLIID